jgi:hypothetical protein
MGQKHLLTELYLRSPANRFCLLDMPTSWRIHSLDCYGLANGLALHKHNNKLQPQQAKVTLTHPLTDMLRDKFISPMSPRGSAVEFSLRVEQEGHPRWRRPTVNLSSERFRSISASAGI